MAEGERDLVVLTQVGQPVPGEQALGPDHEIGPERGQGVEEHRGAGRQIPLEDGLALVVQDVCEQGPGVPVDVAVESVLAGVMHVFVLAGDGPS
ncbi:MAG TPA: hypothetical protein VM597_22140 [Gemmataceae bacterium]|nr:hypothetical protein [Gemmataceae bacterium]